MAMVSALAVRAGRGPSISIVLVVTRYRLNPCADAASLMLRTRLPERTGVTKRTFSSP
jgi:hypothetical protein